MNHSRIQKSSSWTPQIQKKAPSFAPPPIVVPQAPVSGDTEVPMPEYKPLPPDYKVEDHPLMRQFNRSKPIQTKLTIGAPGDKYEQEADAVARKVVSQINSPVAQRDLAGETDLQPKPATKILQRHPEGRNITVSPSPFAGMMQRKEAIGGGEASSEIESSINRAKGGGQSLPPSLQQSMGQAMGADFGGVKVHTDSQSDSLNRSLSSRAFTTGNHVFFKRGEYNPGSQGGQELIAHELTHVVQQGSASIQAARKTIQMDRVNGVPHENPGVEKLNYGIMRERAEIANRWLENFMRDFASPMGEVHMGPIKTEDSALRKFNAVFDKKVEQADRKNSTKTELINQVWNEDVTDLARGTITYRNLWSLYAARAELDAKLTAEGFDWWCRDSWFEKQWNRDKGQLEYREGYKDINYAIQIKPDDWEKYNLPERPFTHVVELQLNWEPMFNAKDIAHATYEVARLQDQVAATFDHPAKARENLERVIRLVAENGPSSDDLNSAIIKLEDIKFEISANNHISSKAARDAANLIGMTYYEMQTREKEQMLEIYRRDLTQDPRIVQPPRR